MHGALRLFNLLIALGVQEAAPAGDAVGGRVGYAATGVPTGVDAAIQAGLRRGSTPIVPIETSGCGEGDGECWRKTAEAAGLSFFVVPELVPVGPDARLTLTLRESRKGRPLSTVEMVCEICGDAELEAMATDLAGTFAPRLARLDEQSSLLTISGSPAGAEVRIDGEPVGTLPWSGIVAPGAHAIAVESRAYLGHRREVDLTPGVDETLHVVLAPDARGATERPAERPSPAAPSSRVGVAAGVLAGGVVVMAGGIVLSALHRRPYGCDEGNPESVEGRCPRRWNTMWLGASLTVAGAAVTGIATYLLIRHAQQQRRNRG